MVFEDFTQRMTRLPLADLSLFEYIESETSTGDKRSLLALKELVAADGPFTYLEIGSHLGGSLQPFVADERCIAIVSIDSRPASVPDKRLAEAERFHYPGNSAERMRSLLAAIPGADVSKIQTIDASTERIDPASIQATPALCLIDGEHTDIAALRDAVFCAAVAPRALIAFHDRGVVGRGLSAFMRAVGGSGHPLPDSIFVVDLACTGRLYALQKRPGIWRAVNAARLAGEAVAVEAFLKLTARRARVALGLPEFRKP